jgi:amino acid adenylation domain-containing protein
MVRSAWWESVVNSRSGSPENGAFVHSLLATAVASTPDSPAIRDASGRWTYAELAVAAEAFACWLRLRGVRPGDRVLVQAATDRRLAAMFYGTSLAGAAFVPINPAMREFHLRGVLRNAEPRLVVVDPEGAGVMRTAVGLDGPVVYENPAVWRQVEALCGPQVETLRTPVADDPGIGPDGVAALIYTSGSTAEPKAVIAPHAQVTFAARAIQAVLGYRPDDVVFCRFPMSWDYGLYKVLLACLGGSELVLAGGESDLLLLQRMRQTGATIVPIVPSLASMIITLTRRDAEPPPPVRMFTNTGAALPRATIDALRTAFPGARVVRQFGQTECKRISIMPPAEELERPDSVGRPLPGTEVTIIDAQGRPLPPGEVGEIVVSGPHVMPGYWRAPELTARTFRRDPQTGRTRLHTGDYGRLDADGYLYFEGRRDDMFKRKGIRMSTLEIEAAAMDIPGVRAAAALPPTDERDLTLYVETELTARYVQREIASRLEPAKVPAHCHVVAELPLTLHGKHSRTDLAGMIEAGAR